MVQTGLDASNATFPPAAGCGVAGLCPPRIIWSPLLLAGGSHVPVSRKDPFTVTILA